MAVICVNTSSPEFKGLLEKTHFSEGTLKSIIHEYQNTPSLWEKGQGLWPSDDYVMNYFNTRFAGSPAQIAVWEGRFRTPHVYESYRDANTEKQEASKWFNEEYISVYENANGKWVVRVARPLDTKTIRKMSDAWLQDLQKDLNATVNTGAYGRYIPNKNEKWKNVPAMDYLGKRLDNFYRQRGLKVQAYWSTNSKKWMVRYAPEEKGYVDDISGGITDWTEGQKNAIDQLLKFLENPTEGGRYMLLEGAAGTGKALPVDTIIPTPNGFRRFGDIVVGDYVYDRHGQPTKVTGVFPQGVLDSYTVVLSDGRKVKCNDEHIWSCYTSKGNLKDFTLRQIIDKGLKENSNPKASFRFKIPTNECITGTQLDLPVDPYILGVFLGNGCCKENLLTLSSADEFTVKQVADILGLTSDKNCGANYSWTFFRPEPIEGKMGKTSTKVHTDEIFGDIAEYICVEAGKKRIPDIYKLAGYAQRLSLLQGLLDTDGSIQYAGGRYNISYSTTSEQLAQDIMDIIRSLGYGCSLHIDNRGIEKYKSGVCYQVNLQVSNKDKQTLFHLPRKRTIAEEAAAFSKRRNYDRVEIVDVYKNEHPEEMVCIYVDNEEHLFLANDYVVTHNTTLINEVLRRLNRGGRPHVLIGALSHKAKGVLDSKITKANKTKYMVEAKSLAGMLGMKMTMKNINGQWQEVFEVDRQARKMGIPIQSANIVFIDEASMVSEEAMAYIEELVGYGTKIVFLGDQRQLPPIRTGGTEFWNKHPELLQNPEADSPVFTRTDIPRVSLTERVRQGEDSPIHMVTDQFGNYTLQGGQFPNLSGTQSSKDLRLIIERPDTKLSDQMLPLFQEGMKTQNPNFAKIVAFTNAKVNQYNMELHFLLHPEMAANRDMNFAEGDMITMYDSFTPFGAREPAVHNAEEGIVTASSDTQHMTTRTGADIRYRNYTIKMQDGRTINIPVLEQDSQNIQAYNSALETLKKQAIADGGSWAWRPYYELKESMANMKMGYASTIHKSQGSTYQVVGVDTTDSFNSPRFKSQAIYTALTRASNISILKGMGSTNAAPSAEAIAQANAEQISKRKEKKSIKDITTKGLTQEQINHIHAETDEIATVIKQALKTVESYNIAGMPDISQPLNTVAPGTIMDATDVLRMVVTSSGSEQQKALAKALLPLFSKMKINVLFTELEDTVDEEGNIAKAPAGTTWENRKPEGYDVRINLNSKKIKAMPAKTVLHELVHALTVNRLYNDAEFNKGVTELMDYVDMWLDQHGVPELSDWGKIGDRHYKLRRDIYGMYNPQEFLAEAMSNPYFQEVLKNIPAPEDSRLSTWQKLCKIIANAFSSLLHLNFGKRSSVYDMLIPVIADTMVVTSEQEDRTAPFTEWNMDRTEQMMSNAYEVVKAMNVAVDIAKPYNRRTSKQATVRLNKVSGGKFNVNPETMKGVILTDANGHSIFNAMGRTFVLCNVNGIVIPFYQSSRGTSGKVKGAWYPFFGYTGNWLIKGDVDNEGKMSYSSEIDRITNLLNKDFVIPTDFNNKGISDSTGLNVRDLGLNMYTVFDRFGKDMSDVGTKDPNELVFYDNDLKELTNANALFVKEITGIKTKGIRQSHASGSFIQPFIDATNINNVSKVVDAKPQSYEGMITPEPNTIFVFGSNPEGRHGAGAAKTAREKFGAIYGQGEGLQGNAYALPTKDLRVTANRGLKSISPEQITENIRKMYEVARQNPDKQFKVAYTHGLNETSLNGYTGAEMIKMFKDAGPIPENVIFSKNWTGHWNEVQSSTENQQSAQSSSSTGGNKAVVKKDDTIRITRVDGTTFNAKIADIQPRVNGFSLSYISPEDGLTRVIESDINGNPVDFSTKYYATVTTIDGNPIELFLTPKSEPTQEELYKTALKDTVNRINYLEGQIGYVDNKIRYNQATSADYTWKQECEDKLAKEQKLLEAAKNGKAEVYLNDSNVPFLREKLEKPVEKNIVVDDAYEVSPVETKKEGYTQGVIIRKKNMQATAKQGADQIARLIEQDKLQPGTHVMWQGLNNSELAALNRVNGLNKNEDGSWTVGYTEREMGLRKQNDTLLNNPMFGSHELHKLAALTMFKLSETITQLQDGTVKIEDILMDESLTDTIRQTNFKGMDRIDIINAIGLDKLFKDVIRESVFNPDINTVLQEDFDLADKAQVIYDNFDAFIRLGYQELINLENISIDTERPVQSEAEKQKDNNGEDLTEEEVVALFGSTVEHWQVGFRQVSTFTSLSKLIRQHLNRLYVLDKEGNKVTDEYGVEQNIDAHEAVSKILKWTQGARDLEDMISKLEAKIPQEPWVKQLTDTLRADGNEQFKSQFFSNFKKYFQKYNIIYKEKTKSGGTVTRVKTINRDPYVISTLDMLVSLDNSKHIGSFNLWDARKNSIDSNAIKAIGFGVTSLEALLNYKRGGMKMDTELWNRHIEFVERALNALNIPMPSRELLIQTLDSPNVLNSMYTAVKGLYDTFSRVPTGDANYKFVNSKTQSNYTRIIEAFAPVMGDGLDSVSYEAGKLHYSYVTPSYLSKFVENMKGMRGDVKAFIESEYGNIEGWFRNRRNNANQAGGEGWLNYWLDRMMDTTEEAQRTREKFDHIVVLSDNGTSYADKSPVQYMASLLSMYLYDDHKQSAFFRIPMMSNKQSEEYIKFDRISDNFKEVITDWLVDKTYAQELNRIRAVNFRNNAPAELAKLKAKKSLTAEEQERVNELEEYLKDGNPAKISSFDENGATFMFMEYLNDYLEDANSELGKLIRKQIRGEKFDESINESARFRELLRQAVTGSLDERFNEFLRSLGREGFLQLNPAMEVVKVNALQDKLPQATAKQTLEEFFWNDMFASINLMQLLCTDIAYYKNTEDLQKRFAQWHSPGLRGDVNATINGQPVTDGNTRSMYIADRVEGSDVIETLKKVKEKVLAQDRFRDNAPAKALMAAQFDKVIKAFEDVNVTDAQAYTSPTGYRKKMAVFGQWTPRDEEVYQRILSGDFTAEDLDVMWQPLKPFVYSQIEKRGFNPYVPTLKMGVQQKNSEYCLILADALIRSAGMESKLTAIFDFMEESHKQNPMKGIDTIMFNSAVKTGLMGVLDINDTNLSHDDVVNYLKDMSGMSQGEYDDRYVHTIPFDDYSIQQYNPAHFEGEQQMGSQNRVLVFADMPNEIDGVEQFIEVDGKPVSVKQAKINYFKAIIDNIAISKAGIKDRFALDSKSRALKNVALMRVLQEEIAKDARYGTDLQWACMLDDSGNFNIPLSDAIQSDRIQQLLNSIIKNRINKQEIAGGPVVQVSNYGTSEDLKIVRNADGTIKYFECYVTAYDPQLYEDFGDGKGGIDMKKIEAANHKLLEMIGYRIPTEAKYSMAPLKIKGFLPKTGGEGIMLPKEITTLSGSDFDVDKMYIMRYQLDRTDNREQVIKEIEDEYKAAGRNGIASRVRSLINGEMQPRDAADYLILYSWRSKHKIEYKDYEKGKYHNDNLIIATQWGILTAGMAEDQVLSSGNFDDVKKVGYMMAAMDNGTKYEDATKMSGKALKSAAYTNKYLQYADTQMQFHKQNMVAAKLIGVFAQANVSHAIVGMSDERAEIQIPEGGALTINGQSYFAGKRYLVDEEYGLDNATRISTVLAQLLASSVDAVKDPVLNLLNINMDTVNIAVTLVRLGHDLEFIGLFLTHPIIRQLINRYNIEKASGSTNSLMQTLQAMQKELLGEDGKGATLQMQYNYDKGFFVREHNVWEAQNDAQRQYKKDMDLTVLELFKKLNNMAEMFRGVVHTTRYNSITSAVGPYASDTMNNRLMDEQFAANSYVTEELKKAAEGIIYDENGNEVSIIQAFRDTSSDLERELLGDNIIQASDETFKVYAALKGKMGYMSAKMAREFGRFYMSYYMNMENPLFNLSDENRKEMIDNFPKKFMAKKNQYRDNSFVQAIMLDQDKAGNDILTLNTRGLTDSEIQALRSSWSDLYTSEREKGIADADNLALKLVEYNFFLGSFGFSPKTFMALTPNAVKLAIPGYKESLTKQLSMTPDRVENLLAQFMLNLGYANLGTLKEKDLDWSSGDLLPDRIFAKDVKSSGLAKVQMEDGTTQWLYVEPIDHSPMVRAYFVDKLGGENQQCFEIDPSRKVYQMKSIVENAEPMSAAEAQPDGGQSVEPLVDDGRTIYQHLVPLLAAVKGGYLMDNPRQNMANIQDRFNKLYNAGQQSFISNVTGLSTAVIDRVAEVLGVTQDELLSDVTESENKLNLCK